jgi:hypothetical protein
MLGKQLLFQDFQPIVGSPERQVGFLFQGVEASPAWRTPFCGAVTTHTTVIVVRTLIVQTNIVPTSSFSLSLADGTTVEDDPELTGIQAQRQSPPGPVKGEDVQVE